MWYGKSSSCKELAGGDCTLELEYVLGNKKCGVDTAFCSGTVLAQEGTVADKRETEDSVVAKEKLTKQVMKLLTCVAALKGKETKGNKAVTDLKVMFNVAERRTNDIASEKVGTQACLQES